MNEPEPPAISEKPIIKEPEQEPEAKPDPKPEVYDGPTNPLTGLPVDEDISNMRPYAVMFNNINIATPQCGISKADIIYETLAEGGITRLEAIFQDITVTNTLGSIRSSRPYFLDLAQGHDAVYIHAGGSDDAYIQIRSRGVANIDGVNGSGETFFRDSWRRNNMGFEHSLMLDTTLIAAYMEKREIRTEHDSDYEYNISFTDEPKPDGDMAENINVIFSSGKYTEFDYDSSDKEYKANQYGSEMTDSIDGEQLSVKNVLVLYAKMGQISGDDKGRLYAEFTGEGTGYFACEGSCIPIIWSKTGYTSQFNYTREDGTELELGRGTSYVCIIPISSGSVNFS